MIWSVAMASVLISVFFYQIVIFIERRVLGQYGMQPAE
jgi:sulfonate transport system permease protein